ncbi:MAG: hypothetical protein L0216_05350 [Planctomycetales bacterium]|nr:hypothetical protein [Planctomycetales bacterium]
MASMIRKQLYIEPRQEKLLKELAARLGVTEAEILRRGLDRGLGGEAVPTPDPQAWERAKDFMSRRMRKGPLPRGRLWSREDLYDE